jgi:hypothetical protein
LFKALLQLTGLLALDLRAQLGRDLSQSGQRRFRIHLGRTLDACLGTAPLNV